jgi:precorrin-3B synthase
MQTGDGLLARINAIGGITPLTFACLCKAALRHGNGMVEITQRGNIQIRGLSAASAPVFANEVAALEIKSAAGVPVTTNPLAGLDPTELIDGSLLIRELLAALAETNLASRLNAKVSIVVDGGGVLHLDALSADIRLRAVAHSSALLWHLAVGGVAAQSTPLGAVTLEQAAEAVIRLLRVIAERGAAVRARNVLRVPGPDLFREAIKDFLVVVASPAGRGSPEFIGLHRTRGDLVALGLGPAFHGDAEVLIELAYAASAAGATGFRPGPDRTLFITGLRPDAAGDLLKAAQRLGFIVRSDDPRRHVAACAGAPICASGEIAARALAPLIAQAAASLLDGSIDLHVSGCSKGCAHAGRAALTIVGLGGRCGIAVNGSARDRPIAEIPQQDLAESLARLARETEAARRDGEHTSDVLARWGTARIAAVLAGELVGA